jgi:hypothetical protein
MDLALWQRLTICTPVVCGSGVLANPTAHAIIVFSLGFAAFCLAFLSKTLRPMMLLTGGYLVGFAHHMFGHLSIP